jgi:hypothetical protein
MATEPNPAPSAVGIWADTSADLRLTIKGDATYLDKPNEHLGIPASSIVSGDSIFVTTPTTLYSLRIFADSLSGVGGEQNSIVFFKEK